MQESILWVGEIQDSRIIDDLKQSEYVVNTVFNAEDAVAFSRTLQIDVLILNIIEGEEASLSLVNRLIRTLNREQRGRRFPVILIMEYHDTESIVDGFEAGANDVIVHPVQSEELLARIQNLLGIFQISQVHQNRTVTVDDLIIEPQSRSVKRGDTSMALTAKEYDLLLYLASHANQVCSREEILKKVWDYDFDMGTNVVDVYIRHLRKKVDRGYRNKLIHTVRGVGYILKEG